MNAGPAKPTEAADYIRAAMARSAPEFAPALYEEYDYVALLRASLDRDIEAQKEQNEAPERDRRAHPPARRRGSRRALLQPGTARALPHGGRPLPDLPEACGYVDGWTPANSYMKGKLDMDGLIAELNNR